MNRTELREIFNKFQKKAVIELNGDDALTGKFISVERIGNVWDVYFHNVTAIKQNKFSEVLGVRKLNNMLALLPESISPHILDGEAWFQTDNTDWLKDWLFEHRKALGLFSRPPPKPRGFKKVEKT